MSSSYKIAELKSIPSLSELKRYKKNLKAVFFDMDGTLIDTEALHAKACIELIKRLRPEFKLPTSEEVKHLAEEVIGKPDPIVMAHLQEQNFFSSEYSVEWLVAEKNELLLQNINELKKDPHFLSKCLAPEMISLLEELTQAQIPLFLVTASEGPLAIRVLDGFSLSPYFSQMIFRETTKKSKPFPYPYLLALEKSGEIKEEILILEDSDTGMESAERAGISYIQASWYPGINNIELQ